MSNRAAPGSKCKAMKMANKKASAASHADDLAIGLNSGVRKLIGDDEVICMGCLATKNGSGNGPDTCSCSGGRQPPDPSFDQRHALIAAAKARSAALSKQKRQNASAAQSSVQKEKAEKKKANSGASCLEDDVVYGIQGEEANEVVQKVVFEVAKLGMSLKKNAVNEFEEGQAEELGVKVGWVIKQVGDVFISSGDPKAQPKKEIMKAVGKASKEGQIVINFRVPLADTDCYCCFCDKFCPEKKFDWDNQCSGPGADMCTDCESMAGMEY